MEEEQCDGGGTVGWRGNSVMEGDQEDLARLVYIIHSYTHTHTQTHTCTLTEWYKYINLRQQILKKDWGGFNTKKLNFP